MHCNIVVFNGACSICLILFRFKVFEQAPACFFYCRQLAIAARFFFESVCLHVFLCQTRLFTVQFQPAFLTNREKWKQRLILVL